jgi:hypothetical protein
MEKITTSAQLNNAIIELENQRAIEWILLKEQFLITAETLKPINIVKGTFKELISLPETKVSLVKTALGIATGLVASKLMDGKVATPWANILVSVLTRVGTSSGIMEKFKSMMSASAKNASAAKDYPGNNLREGEFMKWPST